MKRFKFNLESVLNIRKKKEDENLKSLAEVVGKINQFKKDIKSNEDAIESQNNAFTAYLQKEASLDQYTIHQRFLNRLQIENEEFHNKINEESENYEKARIEYIEASKQKKILEILKEKKLRLHNEQIIKEEIMEQEEFNNNLLNLKRKKIKNGSDRIKPEVTTHDEDDYYETLVEKYQSDFDKLKEQYSKLL